MPHPFLLVKPLVGELAYVHGITVPKSFTSLDIVVGNEARERQTELIGRFRSKATEVLDFNLALNPNTDQWSASVVDKA